MTFSPYQFAPLQVSKLLESSSDVPGKDIGTTNLMLHQRCRICRRCVMSARLVSDNKIQLKFRTKDFEGEYFHYTGDLFFIYKSGHLMKLMCQKREG
jgi:hypothetical protein